MERSANVIISIIVPVYNVERYIRRCIDSIISQTFENWECILVDDGSTDSSGKICDEYVARDSRFKVFHKPNGGVSSARNVGLENATGEWITFIDADDYLPGDAIMRLFKGTVCENVDFVIGGYLCCSEGGAVLYAIDKEEEKVLDRDAALKEMYSPSDYQYLGYCCSKLFKKSTIAENNILFDERFFFNEDRLFCTSYICRKRGLTFYLTHSVYCYVKRAEGAMGSLSKHYNKKFVTDFDAYVQMKKEIFKATNNRQLRKYALRGICQSFDTNHFLMIRFGEYSGDAHRHLVVGLVKSGALPMYLRDYLVGAIRKLLDPILLLLWPNLWVMVSKRER